MAERITALWAGIADWLRVNAPRTHATLQPPATDSDLRRLSDQLDLEIPADLLESLRFCDGVAVRQEDAFTLPAMFHVLGAAEIAAQANVGAEILRNSPDSIGWYWHPAWIPIAADFAGDYLVYDTRQARPFGAVFRRDMTDGPYGVNWVTFEDLLHDVLDMLTGAGASRVGRLPADYTRPPLWTRVRPIVRDGLLNWE